MSIKNGFNIFVMLALLAFGPKENRDFFFRTPPDRLYGEAEIFRKDGLSLSLARNASTDNVELLDETPVRVRSIDLKDGSYYMSEREGKIYPESLSVLERQVSQASGLRSVRVGSAHPRTPRSLYVATEGEIFYRFLWPGIIVLLAVGLTYVINDYSWECGAPIRDIIKSTESP